MGYLVILTDKCEHIRLTGTFILEGIKISFRNSRIWWHSHAHGQVSGF